MPAPPPPDSLTERDTLSRLERSVRQGDWSATGKLTALLVGERVPQTPEALEEYLERIRAVLIEARIGRASLALSLNRLRAVAKFTNSRSIDQRQVSVISAKN